MILQTRDVAGYPPAQIHERALIIAGFAPSLIRFRGALLGAMQEGGVEVVAVAPRLDSDTESRMLLESKGIRTRSVALQRNGLDARADAMAFIHLVMIMRSERPALVLAYTIKPVIWGMLAAWLAGVPRRYALITGLGYAFTGKVGGKRRIIQAIARRLYKVALSRASGVMFQNPDDAALFADLGLLSANVPVTVVNGSGVDLDHYRPAPLPDGPPTFLLVARLLISKGIREYVRAAQMVKRTHPRARFLLVGEPDSNPDAIGSHELNYWEADGAVEFLGQQPDVRPFLAGCHAFVLPSYREGTPRSTLEALATGRAIITTDAPGCRETVIEGENGFLVSVGDAEQIATAMRRLLDQPSLFVRMGARSLEIARERYDVHSVNRQMLKSMGMMR